MHNVLLLNMNCKPPATELYLVTPIVQQRKHKQSCHTQYDWMHIKDKEQVKLAIRVPLNENEDLHTALAKLSFSTEYT